MAGLWQPRSVAGLSRSAAGLYRSVEPRSVAVSAPGNQSQRPGGGQGSDIFTPTFLHRKKGEMARSRLIEKAFLPGWLHRWMALRYSFQLAAFYRSSDKIQGGKTQSQNFKSVTAAAGSRRLMALFVQL